MVLLYGGLCNGFPLVTYDTGTYPGSGPTLAVPDDRPLTYGLFRRGASLHFSLWFVIFFQCLILAGLLLLLLLLRYLEVYVPRVRHPATRLALLVGFALHGNGAPPACGPDTPPYSQVKRLSLKAVCQPKPGTPHAAPGSSARHRAAPNERTAGRVRRRNRLSKQVQYQQRLAQTISGQTIYFVCPEIVWASSGVGYPMEEITRTQLGLTQERLASWLGIPRTSVALAERGHQPWPVGTGLQSARLDLAALGLVPHPTGATPPVLAPPALPVPDPEPLPLQRRLDDCQYRAGRLRYALKNLRHRAARFEARYTALPALRAWSGPVKHPEREARWLLDFEEDAAYELRYVCGAGPQRLLEARIAGLELEITLLEETLVGLPPAP